MREGEEGREASEAPKDLHLPHVYIKKLIHTTMSLAALCAINYKMHERGEELREKEERGRGEREGGRN